MGAPASSFQSSEHRPIEEPSPRPVGRIAPPPAPSPGTAAGATATGATDAATEPPPLPSTREAALALLLREGEATASMLADQLAVSVQVMRRHLRSLEEDGLVESCPCQEGPGRPSNRWHLTAAGQARFPNGSEQFALGLLHSLSTLMPPESMQVLLGQQAEDKAAAYRILIGAGSLQQRLGRLVELRRGEGYVAESRPDPDHAEAWLISEFHCSVMRIAEAFPIVCDQELQLIRHTFPDCQVERVHWRLEEGHFCGFRLIPVPPVP